MINNAIKYFDLQSDARGASRLEGKDKKGPSKDLTVFPQYLALVLGILVQPYFEKYRATKTWAVDLGAVWGWLLFALIAGLIIFPSVYRKAFDAGQPKFVQFCVIFVSGIGWKALLDTVKALA